MKILKKIVGSCTGMPLILPNTNVTRNLNTTYPTQLFQSQRYLMFLSCWKFLVTFFFCFFFSIFFLWTLSEWTVENFSSLFCFCFFFFFFLLYSYLARDSCKKWQEIINKLGLISRINCWKFLVTILFLFFCFLLSFILYLARDSCKKWQENIDKLVKISQIKPLLQRFLVNKNTILDWKTITLFFSIKNPQQPIDIVICNQCHSLKSVVRNRAFLGCVSHFKG